MGQRTLFFAVLLSLAFAAGGVDAQTKGRMSRYWDGCKPSCSWKDKTFYGGVGVCKECDINDSPISPPGPLVYENNNSSCDGGPAYTCWDMGPFASATDPNLAYGFAATPSDQCGKCFELTFDGLGYYETDPKNYHGLIKGKKMIVMGSNMGHDVSSGQFDLLVPGGGLGNFDSFSAQIGVSVDDLGERGGGLLNTCEKELGYYPDRTLDYKPCLAAKCESVFARQPALKQGCLFYANWLEGANNPTLTYVEVDCPQLLKDIYSGMAPGLIDPSAPPIITAVLHGAAGRNMRAKVSLTPAAKGFAVALPAGHGYVGYSLIDLRGREVRSGRIGADATNLRISGLSRSVMFLKLSGKGGASPLVLRAVAY